MRQESGVVVIIQLKKRYGCFFKNKETKELVFALYEDIEGYIHYKYCDYDTEKYLMRSVLFLDDFQRDD